MSIDETPEVQGDEEIVEGEEVETSPDGEEGAPDGSEGAEGEGTPETPAAPEVDPDEKLLNDTISADPKLQARYDAAKRLADAGDHEESNRILDKIGVELGLIDKDAPVAPVAAATPGASDPLTATPERATTADIAFRKSEFSVIQGLQSTVQAQRNNINECDRLAREFQQTVEKEGEDSYGAKMLKQNWNALNNTVQQQSQYIQNCETDKHFLENVIKPNIQQMPWLGPVKDLYLEAIVKKMVDPFASPDVQRQQLINAGVKFPAPAKAAEKPTKAAFDKLKKMNSMSKPRGASGGAAPKVAIAAAKAKVQNMPKLTTAQLAEYRSNGGRLIKAG